MSELEERINAVLGDPAQLEKITMMARSLMGGGGEGAQNAANQATGGILGELGLDSDAMGRIGRLINAQNSNPGAGQAMLQAMRPYLSDKRREKVDKALKIARLAKLAGLAMGEMEGGGND